MRLKTSETRAEISVPYLSELPLICPAFATKTLWERVQQANTNTNSQLPNTNTFAPLTAGEIRKLAKEALTNAGIPDTFPPYSIKAASISALTMAGIPPVQVAKFARLSPQTNTLVKHYFRADLASAMGRVTASSTERVIKQAQRAEKVEQKGRKESQNKDEKKVAIVKKQYNMSKRNEKIQASDDSQAIMPSKIEEPKEEEKEDTEYDKRFIIRTRAQSKKEEIQKEWKVSKAVVMMVSEIPN